MKENIGNIIREELKPLADFVKFLPKVYSVAERSLSDFKTEYEKFIECNYSPKYLESVQLTFKHFLKFISPARALNTITSKEIEAFVTWLRKGAPKGYDVYFRNLKAALGKAIDWNYISENPCKKIKLPKKQKNNPEFINELEMLQIVEKIDNPKIGNAVKFAFYTGVRLNELVNLRWRNINIKNKRLTIGDTKFMTKSKKQRVIPLHDKVLKLLEEIKPKGESRDYAKYYVFGKSRVQPYTGDCLSKKFKKALREVGIEDSIKFHSLRHSYASYLVQRGVSIYIIKDLLGHSSTTVTERYSHLNMDSLQEAVNKFN